MSDAAVITVTAMLVATACALLGPFLVLRRVALMGDAVSHAVLPGIVLAFLVFHTRAPVVVVAGAALFAVICVLAIDALTASRLVKADAAIGLVFPTLFALGVLGVQRHAANVHLDLDSTIYGEIAFAPFRLMEVGGMTLPASIVAIGVVVVANLMLVALAWKELKVTSFDPAFASSVGLSPRLVSRLLLLAVAVTAVSAFESVGAILVVTLLIVPAATAYLLTDRLVAMVAGSVAVGWIAAIGGYQAAIAIDASIAGSMGLVAAGCFAVALLGSPRYGIVARALRARRYRQTVRELHATGTATPQRPRTLGGDTPMA